MNTRKIALALTLLAGTLAAGAAQAGGPEVQWSVTLATPTIRLPGHVLLPLPPIPVPPRGCFNAAPAAALVPAGAWL